MAEIEKVIDGLEQLKFFNQRAGRELWNDKPIDVQNLDIDNTEKKLNQAIQTIRELQNQIPKWHLVSEGDLSTDYMDVLLVVDRYSYVIEDWCRDTVQTYWNGDMKAFDYCKGWQAGHEPKIIAWMELPKFEGVE